MAGHSRSKNGVASLAFVPAIHVLAEPRRREDVDARDKPGHDNPWSKRSNSIDPFLS
jgi:hypothetical protein